MSSKSQALLEMFSLLIISVAYYLRVKYELIVELPWGSGLTHTIAKVRVADFSEFYFDESFQ